MASSPRTPRHSRQSTLDNTSFQIPSNGSSPVVIRRASKSSFQDSLRSSMNDQDDSMFSGAGANNGLGNLADELADAFLDEDEMEEGYYEEDGQRSHEITLDRPHANGRDGTEGIRDSGVDVETLIDNHNGSNGNNSSDDQQQQQQQQQQTSTRSKHTSLGVPPNMKGHRRQGSEYDGSEYGSESDLESSGMPPSLVARMDAVESLARRGTGEAPGDNVFKRMTEGLQDLGSQSSVEGSTTRLITAHSALATHLAHQTRQLHNLTFPLLSPLVTPPDAETVDDLLPLLVTLSEDMPRPATTAYNSLTALHSVTSDLVQTLNYLSDTLHMSRQTTTTATRRLKSAKEMVAEIKREEELKEEGEAWLTRNNWGERLEKRECAGVCRDVVGGFEEVCNDWRARLVAQAESA